MRLTVYTDYTLRVMIYLGAKHREGSGATIDEMARAYGISRNHLMKIVHELGRNGFIETMRGRTGGARLARPPERISIGEIVRMAEKDFAVVECHDAHAEPQCAVFPACNLKKALRRAVEAFLRELDSLTLQDAVTAPRTAASLLGITPVPVALPQRGGAGRRRAAA
jgi:Rrf2 family nitric oxide-sensitive transcriptional repressor